MNARRREEWKKVLDDGRFPACMSPLGHNFIRKKTPPPE
jgi:hypothetical protein